MYRRLLFVVNDAGFFLSHRLNIARAALEDGWEVHVATADGPAVTRVQAEGFWHHTVALSRSGANPMAELRTLWALFRLFRRLRPTLVHAVTIKPVVYSGLLAPWAGVPALVQAISGLGHVFIAEGRLAALRRKMIAAAYRLAFRHPNSRVIFQNPDDLAALGQAIRDGQAVLIPGAGVDPEKFAPRPEPPGEPLVVLASRMLWAKGVGEFVEAARRLQERGVSARFALVGDSDPGNPAAVPDDRLRAWAASGVVEWWGRREDMPSVFAKAHVVCLPSYREGLPKVLLEAASCGRAIIATDVPGCREIVRDGHNGLLVPPRDPEALAGAIERALKDRDLRERMGARGREMVLSGFTSAQVVEKTLAVYCELLNRAGVTAEPGFEPTADE
ncbi:Glycosyltransferase involved in cell wall bisynthesis [Desulfacinum hydrothermale DSM 13146]|uniref:Glycosyltransferase involved in cell wall bisynthesis n=1 Tax=Desulfacinum hydrothermale DSM 13146 TaxID=1121390 RepID=A0A1W1XR85_9BACT|nr:glycosyltransferase family 4 protein [Desulfacinum hydrothermale]SMC26500.1 Glycosyltransferase involved in cell wall bisynthesis [Desulfacinum hydrothermale DSM 13146]